jgi:hypothetical protein
VLAGVVDWRTKTYARNAQAFAAARTLRRDLKGVGKKLTEAKRNGTWRPLDDLSLPSWGERQRAALALQLSSTEWQAVEKAVFAVSQFAAAKQRILSRRAASAKAPSARGDRGADR